MSTLCLIHTFSKRIYAPRRFTKSRKSTVEAKCSGQNQEIWEMADETKISGSNRFRNSRKAILKAKSILRVDLGNPGNRQITLDYATSCNINVSGRIRKSGGSILQTKSMLRVDSGSPENRFVKENQCSGQNQESREIFSNQIQCFGQIEIDSRNPGNRLLKQNQCASGRIRKSGKSPVKAKPKCFGQIHPHQSGNQVNWPLKQNQCFGQIQDIRKIAHVNAFKQNPHHGVIMS